MKKWIGLVTIVAGLVCAGGSPALACSAAGPNKHVGEVTAVDNKADLYDHGC